MIVSIHFSKVIAKFKLQIIFKVDLFDLWGQFSKSIIEVTFLFLKSTVEMDVQTPFS